MKVLNLADARRERLADGRLESRPPPGTPAEVVMLDWEQHLPGDEELDRRIREAFPPEVYARHRGEAGERDYALTLATPPELPGALGLMASTTEALEVAFHLPVVAKTPERVVDDELRRALGCMDQAWMNCTITSVQAEIADVMERLRNIVDKRVVDHEVRRALGCLDQAWMNCASTQAEIADVMERLRNIVDK